ncbi:hypothetical protein AGMMS49959_10470 [Planctomycetales bacterium]|nr:hypothetical protein AGMMS49959_10470 [Planctomycetales bacterium]
MSKKYERYFRRFRRCLIVVGIGGALIAAGLTDFVFANHQTNQAAAVEWRWTAAEEKTIRQKLLPQVTANRDGSFSLESADWRVTTYLTPLFTAQAAAYLDFFAAVFQRAFPFKDAAKRRDYKPLALIYKSRADYLRHSGAEEWSAGICRHALGADGKPQITLFTYYEPRERESLAFDDRAPLSTIQHEATHALLFRLLSAPIPLWLNEGAATYYGHWQPRQKITNLGNRPVDVAARRSRADKSAAPERLREFYRARPDAPLPSLSRLIAGDTDKEFYADDGGEATRLNYLLAESFIDFLMRSQKRRPLLQAIIERVQARKKPLTATELRRCEAQWLVFLKDKWDVPLAEKRLRRQLQNLQSRAPVDLSVE